MSLKPAGVPEGTLRISKSRFHVLKAGRRAEDFMCLQGRAGGHTEDFQKTISCVFKAGRCISCVFKAAGGHTDDFMCLSGGRRILEPAARAICPAHPETDPPPAARGLARGGPG